MFSTLCLDSYKIYDSFVLCSIQFWIASKRWSWNRNHEIYERKLKIHFRYKFGSCETQMHKCNQFQQVYTLFLAAPIYFRIQYFGCWWKVQFFVKSFGNTGRNTVAYAHNRLTFETVYFKTEWAMLWIRQRIYKANIHSKKKTFFLKQSFNWFHSTIYVLPILNIYFCLLFSVLPAESAFE